MAERDRPDPLAGLEQRHRLVELTPFEQPLLAYSLVLPKEWRIEEDLGKQPGDVGELTRIGLFAERAAPDAAVVQVSSCAVPAEIGVRNWLGYQASRTGATLRDVKDEEFVAGRVVTARGEAGPAGQKHALWAVALPDGGRIFLVMGLVRADREAAAARNLEIATRSFKLLKPSGTPLFEDIRDFAHGPPKFAVAHPTSWKPQAVPGGPPGKAAVDLRLGDDKGELIGYVRVKAEPATGAFAADAARRTTAEELAVASVKLTGQWKPDPATALKDVPGLKLAEKAEAEVNRAAVEVRLAVVERPPLRFSVVLLSPLRPDNPIGWMRCERAYEIAARTAR